MPEQGLIVELDLNDEQRLLKASLQQFVRREVVPASVGRIYREANGLDEGILARAALAGWVAVGVPEEYGGLSLTMIDHAVIFEELGRSSVPGPYFSSGVLGARILVEAGSQEVKERLLPGLVSGDVRLGVAACDSGIHWSKDDVRSRVAYASGRPYLTGEKRFVHDADASTHFICAARDDHDRVILAIVDSDSPGVSLTRPGGMLTSVSTVTFKSVALHESYQLGAGVDGWEILERAVYLSLPSLSAFLVGACRSVFDMTLEYTRSRHAFGQPIGRFQRVQDHVVGLANHMDVADLITSELLWKLERGLAQPADVYESAAACREAYYECCNYAHMVFAGPGTDLDHPLMTHTMLSRSLYQYLGSPSYHKMRMLDLRYSQ